MDNQINLNKIYQGDCLAYLVDIPDKFFDCAIIDPPYGTKINKMNFVTSGAVKVGGAYRNDYRDHPTNWDEEGLTEQYFKEIQRVSKNQIIFGANNFSNFLPNSRCWVVWDKRTEKKYNNDFADCELIWTSFDKPARVIRFLWSGMLQGDMKNKEKRLHPTQKPIFVISELIKMFTKEGDKVIDCFMGTGSTLVACKQLKRDFVGIELHEKYFKIAQERLQQNILTKSEEVKQEAMQSEARHSSQA